MLAQIPGSVSLLFLLAQLSPLGGGTRTRPAPNPCWVTRGSPLSGSWARRLRSRRDRRQASGRSVPAYRPGDVASFSGVPETMCASGSRLRSDGYGSRRIAAPIRHAGVHHDPAAESVGRQG
jgi:hypothetical protein